MKNFLKRVEEIFHSFRNNFFLKKHIPLKSTMKLLEDLYPSVDWKRVDFYEGLPWFTPMIAPYVTAQALPQFYSFSRYSIYIKVFDESRAQCLADVIHEGYHIMQAMQFWKGYGLGFFRGLMVYYIALFQKYGYRSNPFEITAYDQEFRFLDYCIKHGLHGIMPQVPPGAFKNIFHETSLVFKKYPYTYTENYLLLAGSLFFCSLVTILKPFADLLIFSIRWIIPKVKSENKT